MPQSHLPYFFCSSYVCLIKAHQSVYILLDVLVCSIAVYFFFQASERAGILNPRIWLAKHSHVTGPGFYDTAHGPDFFPAVTIKAAC